MGLPSNGIFFKSNINKLQHIHVYVICENEVFCTLFRKNSPRAQTKEHHCDRLGRLGIAFIAESGHNVM